MRRTRYVLPHDRPAGVAYSITYTLQALPLLKAAYDRGINTWDTANIYCNGASEVIVGKAIKKYNIPRHKIVVMTKCHWAVGEDQGE